MLIGCTLALAAFLPAQATLTAGQARQQALEDAWSKELQEPKQVAYKSPIQRVVGLLTKMRDELAAEADKEAEMYDKMVCWCETNEKEKKKAIADAEALEKELEAEIQERAAKFGEQSTEIERLKSQISEDTASLKEGTSIREAEAAKFRESNKDLIQSITNVKNAIDVLSKHNSASSSFIQLDASVLSSMHTVLKDLAFKMQLLQADKSEGRQKQRGASFLSLKTDASLGDSLLNMLDASDASGAVPLNLAEKVLAQTAKGINEPAFLQNGAAPSGGSYAPQSGQIFGILTTMKEEFEANLAEEQKDESKAQSDFEGMSAAKSEQIATAKEKLDNFEEANADNQKALSDAKENIELTREQRSKDVEFLQNLKTTCMDLDQQWAKRSKTRSMETQAVSEALKIITADDSMDLLRQTAGFLQVDAESQMRVRRVRAMASLRKAAQAPDFGDDLLAAWHGKVGLNQQKVSMLGAGPRMQLSTLAVAIGLDSFTKIKEAMDKMVADLKAEQEEEVKFKAHCAKELDLNEKQTYEKTEEKEDLEAKIAKLTKLIKKLTEEIAAANTQIAETETAILKASQVREGENAEFQTVVADQRATQDILTKALGKLKAFYKSAKGGAFAQRAAQEPPVKFNSYSKNAGASPVIGMIEQIIEDSKALESESVAAETEAQSSYETFVKDSNALIKELSNSVAAKTKASATAKEDAEQAKSDRDSAIEELESLALTEGDLHGECDWVMRNFAARQKARMDEMEAIGQAKAILSGAK
jgi:chromosome segregation ATPase